MNKFAVQYLVKNILNNLDSTDVYRNFIANRKAHDFFLGRKALITQVKNAFGIDTKDVSDKSKKVDKYCNDFFRDVKSAFPEYNKPGRYSVEHLQNTKDFFRIYVTGPNETSDVYKWIFRKLAPHKTKLYSSIKVLYDTDLKKSDFLDLSHEAGSQVGQNAVYQVIDEIENFFISRPGVKRDQIDTFLLEVTEDLRAISSKSRSAEISTITYRSAKSNRGKQRELDASMKQAMYKAVEKASKKYYEDLLFKKVERDILVGISQKLKKETDIKLSGFRVYDLTELSKEIEEIKRTSKVDSTEYLNATNARRFTARSNALNLKVILNTINRTLPGIVAKNMGTVPKKNVTRNMPLNYRTGRFAQSVRVTGISAGSNNLANIDYTYMTDPYGVFEQGSGSKLASRQRDPRRLIDKSIREAASKLIRQKFNTRRIK